MPFPFQKCSCIYMCDCIKTYIQFLVTNDIAINLVQDVSYAGLKQTG